MNDSGVFNFNFWRCGDGLTLRESSELFNGRSVASISRDCKFLGLSDESGRGAFITEDKALLLFAFYCWRHYNAYSKKDKYWMDCTPTHFYDAGVLPSRETASIEIRERIMVRVAGRMGEQKFRNRYREVFDRVTRTKIQHGIFAEGA